MLSFFLSFPSIASLISCLYDSYLALSFHSIRYLLSLLVYLSPSLSYFPPSSSFFPSLYHTFHLFLPFSFLSYLLYPLLFLSIPFISYVLPLFFPSSLSLPFIFFLTFLHYSFYTPSSSLPYCLHFLSSSVSLSLLFLFFFRSIFSSPSLLSFLLAFLTLLPHFFLTFILFLLHSPLSQLSCLLSPSIVFSFSHIPLYKTFRPLLPLVLSS